MATDHAYDAFLELQALVEGGVAEYHPSVQLVYLALWVRSQVEARVDRGGRDRRCRMTQEELARHLGLGVRTVQRALDALEGHRLIQTVTPGGGRCPAVYRVLLPTGMRQPMRARDPDSHAAQEGEEAGGPAGPARVTEDDRALVATLIEGLADSEREELEQEAIAHLAVQGVEPTAARVADVTARLVMLRYFGPERLRRDEGTP